MKFWDRAWSLVKGCTPVSEGCDNCWLRAMDKRFGKAWSGDVLFREELLDLPLRTRKPTVWAIWSDLYHPAVTQQQLEAVIDTTWHAPEHTFLVVTKRPERAAQNTVLWPDNVYHLITVETQSRADKRIPYALQILSKVGLLIEPMLGPVDISDTYWYVDAFSEKPRHRSEIYFVIVGGETGPKARPLHPDWVRSVRDQCAQAGVPFYLKHLNKKAGRILDGRTHDELPWRENE